MEERYFVEAADGQRYGPADLATLKEWIAGARLTPSSMLIGETSGERKRADEVEGLFGTVDGPPPVVGNAEFSGLPPTAPVAGYAVPPGYVPAEPPRKNRTALWVGGILLGGLCLCGAPVAAVLFPVFAQAKYAAKKTSGLSNIKQLGTGLAIYMADHEDLFPLHTESANAMKPALMPYVRSETLFLSVNPNGGEILGNPRLAKKSAVSLFAPQETVMLYDSLAWPRGEAPVCYADTHSRVIPHTIILSELAKDPFDFDGASGAPTSAE